MKNTIFYFHAEKPQRFKKYTKHELIQLNDISKVEETAFVQEYIITKKEKLREIELIRS